MGNIGHHSGHNPRDFSEDFSIFTPGGIGARGQESDMAANTREYEKTHPHINFGLDLRRAGPEFWMLLGQVVARCEEVAAAVLPPAAAEELYALYLIRGAKASTAIEGNTLSEEQVRAQYEKKGKLPPSREYQGVEVQNTLDAYSEIDLSIREGKPPVLNSDLIFKYNRSVLKGLEERLDKGIVPGAIPEFPIGVGNYRAAPRKDCDYLLNRLCDWMERDLELPASFKELVGKMAESILKGILAHLYIAWIHPFGDGNGRTARLIEYTLLASGGVPLSSAHLLSNHYNLTRDDYYQQLDRSSQVNGGHGDVFGFLTYSLRGFVDGLREQCDKVRDIQLTVSWGTYVYDSFRMEKRSEMANRRREVVLALGRTGSVASKLEILNMSPEIARLYAGKASRTLTRDLIWLLEKGFIEEEGDRYRARVEVMYGFRSLRVDVNQT